MPNRKQALCTTSTKQRSQVANQFKTGLPASDQPPIHRQVLRGGMIEPSRAIAEFVKFPRNPLISSVAFEEFVNSKLLKILYFFTPPGRVLRVRPRTFLSFAKFSDHEAYGSQTQKTQR